MSAPDLNSSGLFQFPVAAAGPSVPIVRLDGVETAQIMLDAQTLARIYLGEISRWNDAPIARLNPGLALPGTRITLAYRLDASASTLALHLLPRRKTPSSRAGTAQLRRSMCRPARRHGVRMEWLDFVRRTNGGDWLRRLRLRARAARRLDPTRSARKAKRCSQRLNPWERRHACRVGDHVRTGPVARCFAR